MLNTKELKEVFRKYDFRPLKRLGENYLIDSNIKDKIITEVHLTSSDTVLEIGPGLGALTGDLSTHAMSVAAVEKDRKAAEILTDLVGADYPNLEIYNSDICDFDINSISSDGKIKVVGNLPYYITTPILEYLIERKSRIASALIVIQKEVAERLLAAPGTKDYGSITCMVQYHTKPEYLYTIKRISFHPVPNVDSALLRLTMLEHPSVEVKDEKLFFRIVRGAFNQRRKSLINSLSRKGVLDMPKEKLSKILDRAGIDPSRRPETLSLAEFAAITNTIN